MRNIRLVTLCVLGTVLIGAVFAQNSESKEIVTPLGYLRGEMEIVGMPKELTGINVTVIAARDREQSSASVAPGHPYAMPLAPGAYQVHAEFGSAKSATVPVTIQNGKTAQQDFAFGKEEKR